MIISWIKISRIRIKINFTFDQLNEGRMEIYHICLITQSINIRRKQVNEILE